MKRRTTPKPRTISRAAADRAKAAHAAWYEVEADSVLALTLLRLGRAEEARAAAARRDSNPTDRRPAFSKLDARFAELAASTGSLNLNSLTELAAEARKAGYIELDFEIRIVRMYSMTKAVTGVAAMILYEEGKFSLTDPVSKYYTVPDNPTTGWNGDQGHHFAAFFEFGYQCGKVAGDAASALFELFQAAFSSIGGNPLNMGDVQLGITAVQMGADLASGKVSPGDVSSLITDKLCQH